MSDTKFKSKLQKVESLIVKGYNKTHLIFSKHVNKFPYFLDQTLTEFTMINKNMGDTIEIQNVFTDRYFKIELESIPQSQAIYSTIVDQLIDKHPEMDYDENGDIPLTNDEAMLQFILLLSYFHYINDNSVETFDNLINNVSELLITKNSSYGDAALSPMNVFSNANSGEGILIRMDDKLKRIKNNPSNEDEDVILDLIGYGILYLISLDCEN